MTVNKKSHSRTLPKVGILLVLISLIAIVAIAAMFVLKPKTTVNSFEECKNSGGAILESYPEQCVLDKQSYTNDSQMVDTDTDKYIGLSEQAAIDKARANNKPVRVVERDGEALVVTADFSPDRLNLYVRDGFVYRVQIEGDQVQ